MPWLNWYLLKISDRKDFLKQKNNFLINFFVWKWNGWSVDFRPPLISDYREWVGQQTFQLNIHTSIPLLHSSTTVAIWNQYARNRTLEKQLFLMNIALFNAKCTAFSKRSICICFLSFNFVLSLFSVQHIKNIK